MPTKPPHNPLSAALNFVIPVFTLPWINLRPVIYDNHDVAIKDLTIARTSILLLVIGLIVIALSPHIVVLATAIMIYALGVGYLGRQPLIRHFLRRARPGRPRPRLPWYARYHRHGGLWPSPL